MLAATAGQPLLRRADAAPAVPAAPLSVLPSVVAFRGMARHTFGSDNHAPVHPEVLAAIAAVNTGHDEPYGADDVTAPPSAAVRRHLGEHAEVAFVFNGTGANLVGLGSRCARGST